MTGEAIERPWKAEEVQAQDLRPGDLFSTQSVFFWEHCGIGVGEKVYIRTGEPCPPDQAEEPVTRIIVNAHDGLVAALRAADKVFAMLLNLDGHFYDCLPGQRWTELGDACSAVCIELRAAAALAGEGK